MEICAGRFRKVMSLLVLATSLMSNSHAYAQGVDTNVTYITRWQIPRSVCFGTEDCRILDVELNAERSAFFLFMENWMLYVFPLNSSTFTRYNLSAYFHFIATYIDIIPFGADFVLIYNGDDKIYRYSLSTRAITVVAPHVNFEACKNSFPGWSRSMSRVGSGPLVLTCFAYWQGRSYNIGLLNAYTGTTVQLDGPYYSYPESPRIEWYNLVAGQDNRIYRQYSGYAKRYPRSWTVSQRGLLLDAQWSDIHISEQELVGWDTDRYSDVQPRNYVEAVDTSSNIYFNLSWVGRETDGGFTFHYRLAKLTPQGKKIWLVAEEIYDGKIPILVGVTDSGNPLFIRYSESGPNSYEVQEAIVHVAPQRTPKPENDVFRVR